MVSLVNINRILYMHVIKKKLDDIDSGKPIIKFVLKLTHSCPCSEKGHRHLQITVLALTRLYSDDHWRFQEHLFPECVMCPSSRSIVTQMSFEDFKSTSLRDGWKVMRRVNPNM